MHSGVSRLIADGGVFALTGVLASMIALACTPPGPKAVHRHRIAKVNSFTEATPVYRVVSAPPYAFAATASGLDQWDLRSGRRIRHEAHSQLFTTRIADLAYDEARGTLWVVSSDGISRYDLFTDTVTNLDPPPSGVALTALASAVLTPAPDGGVYLGVASTLYYADADGVWTEAALRAPVSALHVDRGDGAVYVGTAAGLFALRGSVATALDCDLASVRLLLPAPGGGVLAVGAADAGAQRIALIEGERCESYRASPEIRWLDAATDGDRVVILTSSRVYELAPRAPLERARELRRDGMTLLPTRPSRDQESALVVRPLAASVPPGAQTVALSGGELLVGTHSLGTARLSIEPRGADSDDSRWLRREELAADAALLSVHCEDLDECRLANGSGELWGFDGERFVRSRQKQLVLGLVEVAGAVVAVVGQGEDSVVGLLASPASGALAEPAVRAGVRVPPGYQLRRLRPGPEKSVLLGWTRSDAEPGEPLALAHLVRLDGGVGRTLGVGGAALYDVVACGARLYASSEDGISDITSAVPVLVSTEVARRLECDREQLVAATETAIIRRGDQEWSEVVPLTQEVRDFSVAPDGRIFLADAAGLGIWDGDRVRRYDARRGLLENDIREIALDRFGRIWIRGATGVGLFRL